MYSDTLLCVGEGWSLLVDGWLTWWRWSQRAAGLVPSTSLPPEMTLSWSPLCPLHVSPCCNQKTLFLFLSLHISFACSEFIWKLPHHTYSLLSNFLHSTIKWTVPIPVIYFFLNNCPSDLKSLYSNLQRYCRNSSKILWLLQLDIKQHFLFALFSSWPSEVSCKLCASMLEKCASAFPQAVSEHCDYGSKVTI